jgi:DNA polymerase I-like protein with 3'-5' exonuclease and polymerase domains
MVIEEKLELKNLVRKQMMSAVTFNVPLEVEIGSGENWLIAH